MIYDKTLDRDADLRGLLISYLMYRLGVSEISIDADDIKAINHTYGGPNVTLMARADSDNNRILFKISAEQ